MNAPKLFTAHEVAERLNVSHARVYELAREHLLPCVRVGRQVRFDPIALETWVAGGGCSFAGGWRRTVLDEEA